MAALGTGTYMTQSPADQTYQQHKGDLHSNAAAQASGQDPDAGSNPNNGQSTPPARTSTGQVRME